MNEVSAADASMAGQGEASKGHEGAGAGAPLSGLWESYSSIAIDGGSLSIMKPLFDGRKPARGAVR
jgi:hypothetical protein